MAELSDQLFTTPLQTVRARVERLILREQQGFACQSEQVRLAGGAAGIED